MKNKGLNNLRNGISKVYETNKLPKGFTLVDFRMLEDNCESLAELGKAETINERVKDCLGCYGFNIINKGIGWEITI